MGDYSFFFFMIIAIAIGLFTILGMLLFKVFKKFRSNPQNKTIASSSSLSHKWKHHVFPSFHGADVRASFLRHILKEFRSKGLDTFIDGQMKRSFDSSIGHEIREAIRGSRIAFVMLSRNYACSRCCLDELVEIIKCKEELGQTVMVLFYEVEPADIKNQTGDFGKVFTKTCKGETKEDTGRWRQALQKVATMAGYHSSNWDNEGAMIENIANDISNQLYNPIPYSDFDGLAGMGAHMEKMEPMLCMDSDEVRMLGIVGPPRVGKTTIAKSLFRKHYDQFQYCVFMEDIKLQYQIPWDDEYSAKLRLQRQFLSKLLKQKGTEDVVSHLGVAQGILKDKKVFVVLDEVDELGQLDALAKETQWFGPGSRIIIITQDQRLLKAHGINHIYKVDFSPPDEATTLSSEYSLGLSIKGSNFPEKIKDQENELPSLKTSEDGDKSLDYCKMNADEFIGKFNPELVKQRQENIIKCQDPKDESLYTSEQAFNRTSNGLRHAVYIYCADTIQYSFASHLSVDFRRKGLYASVNYNGTLDVIDGVCAFVVIFSKNYLSSTSCMDKLVGILQYRKKTSQLLVPVFYGISTSDVVVQEDESADRISKWSSALQELRELPGHHFREECSESQLVDEIVKDVYEKLFPTKQIGISSRLLEIEKLLCKQPWGIRRIGIWGMPGIGKTTLAEAVFEKISGGYEASCFIKHFDKGFDEKGSYRLLEEHFGKVLKELPRVCSSITRSSLPSYNLSKKRTLVVLDDVHSPLAAESFLEGIHWFGPGSLVIITSRDKQVFRLCQINHIYKVHSLNKDEALQLFSQYAFDKDTKDQILLELAMEVVNYANGNPLALSFYGQELKGKKFSGMEITFLLLKLGTPYKIHDLFKRSYETLNDIEKNIFLDIACFFNGENLEYVMQLLEGCGFFPHVGIDVLMEKCLLTISENRVNMHNLIQDFGRDIINRETVQFKRRRRQWEPWAIKVLLEDDKLGENEDPKTTYKHALGTEDIEGIFMDTSSLIFDVKPDAFEDMYNLRFLKIYCSSDKKHHQLGLPKGLKSLPYELRLLHWENYPLQSLPEDFDPCHLVELNMSYSQLRKLWEGPKNLDNLKTARLCHSQQLTEIEGICKAQNIELIDLQGCTKLQNFPATSQLQHLQIVDLTGCREINSFPEVSPNIEELYLEGTGIKILPISIGNATNLEILDVSFCSSLVELPASFGNAINIKKLYFHGCSSLVELPTSIGNAINLEILDLSVCSSLAELPSSFGNFINLKELYLMECSSLVELPLAFGNARNLEKLYLKGCSSLTALPASFGNAINLEILNLSNCSSLVELPSSFGNFINLRELYLNGCSRLVKLPLSFGNAINLKKLYLRGCSSLVELSTSFGNAKNLQILNLSNCSSLVELPSSFGNFTNLKEVNLNGCSRLVKLPLSFGNAINLKKLYLRGCSSLIELPASFGKAINLEILDLSDCSSLVELPSSFGNAINLEMLDLSNCSSLVQLPSSFGNATRLKMLDLSNCSSLVELPSSFGNAISLEMLDLSNCSSLVELPSSFGKLKNLKELYLTDCSSLVKLRLSYRNAISLKKLSLKGCSSLTELPPHLKMP